MDTSMNNYNKMYAPQESNAPSDNSNSMNNNMGNNMGNNNMGNSSPSMENFGNLSDYGINLDLVLKSIFFGLIFYLLSLPEVYKLTAGVFGKKVDGLLLHSLVYAVLYYILVHFI